MFLANVTSVFWEVRKAIMRKMGKIFTYTVFEAISFAIFSSIVLLDLINKKLAIGLSIIILFVLQSFFLYRTREFAKSIIKSSNSSVEKQKVIIHSYGEYIFVGTILVSNLYFMSRGFWEPLGELRALFLLLTLSTFIVGALRNSLITEKIGSKVNKIMVLIFLLNLILIFALPQKYLVQIIPTLPVDLKVILIPVVIDILGSLIFSICSMHSIKKGNLFGSGASRLISSFMTIILINVYFVPRDNLETSAFAWLNAISSISSATFMLFYIYRKKLNSTRRFSRIK